MSDLIGWIFTIAFWVVYLVALVTVASMTFSKGHYVLGILGIFFPILWLIGAVLPAREGSRFDKEQASHYKRRMQADALQELPMR